MAKSEAEVLGEHYIDITETNPDNIGRCVCGFSADPMNISWDDHQAAALSAAGYGLVADAKREAWEDGFTACAYEHMAQDRDPSHPITRTNPYTEASNDDQ